MKLWQLFISFFKIGAFTIGGGYAMIPLMHREIVEKKKWLKEEEALDMVAISESTPGVLAVNFATYVGQKVGGFIGSIVATLSVVLPSFIIIILISLFVEAFSDNQTIQSFLTGVKAGVVVLLFQAVWKLLKISKVTLFNLLMLSVTFFLSVFIGASVFYLLLAGALVGIVYGAFVTKEALRRG